MQWHDGSLSFSCTWVWHMCSTDGVGEQAWVIVKPYQAQSELPDCFLTEPFRNLPKQCLEFPSVTENHEHGKKLWWVCALLTQEICRIATQLLNSRSWPFVCPFFFLLNLVLQGQIITNINIIFTLICNCRDGRGKKEKGWKGENM